MTTFVAILKMLPEIWSLFKTIVSQVQKGVEIIQIKRKLKAIDKAMSNSDRRQAAKELDDVFGS